MTDKNKIQNQVPQGASVNGFEAQSQSERAYRHIAQLISQCRGIEEMVKIMTTQQMMFSGAMAFAVDNNKFTTERAKALYLLRSMYTNAKSTLEQMSEEEFKAVSLRENFIPGDD